jgi:hypothetical protein
VLTGFNPEGVNINFLKKSLSKRWGKFEAFIVAEI